MSPNSTMLCAASVTESTTGHGQNLNRSSAHPAIAPSTNNRKIAETSGMSQLRVSDTGHPSQEADFYCTEAPSRTPGWRRTPKRVRWMT
jgi:hypothetical protein